MTQESELPLDIRFIPEHLRPPARVGEVLSAEIRSKLADLQIAFGDDTYGQVETAIKFAVQNGLDAYPAAASPDTIRTYLTAALRNPRDPHHDAVLSAIYLGGLERFPDEGQRQERNKYYAQQLEALMANKDAMSAYAAWIDVVAQRNALSKVLERCRTLLKLSITTGMESHVPTQADDGDQGGRVARSRLARAAEDGQMLWSADGSAAKQTGVPMRKRHTKTPPRGEG